MDNTAYLVIITSFDSERKILGIMRIREVTGFGLAQAKNLIENCPSEIMRGMYLSQARELTAMLEDAGMSAEIKPDHQNTPELKNLEQIDFSSNED